MAIWQNTPDLNALNALCAGCAVAHLGIQFCAVGEDWLTAEMAIDARTRQPFGFLHGGISAALAETVASAAAALCCKAGEAPFGVELSISHFRSAQSGKVRAKAQPLHLGKNSQVWRVSICNEADQALSEARLSVKIAQIRAAD